MKTARDAGSAAREVAARAEARGQSLIAYVVETLQAKLDNERGGAADPPWMEGFEALRHLHKETARIQSIVDREFGAVDAGDRS